MQYYAFEKVHFSLCIFINKWTITISLLWRLTFSVIEGVKFISFYFLFMHTFVVNRPTFIVISCFLGRLLLFRSLQCKLKRGSVPTSKTMAQITSVKCSRPILLTELQKICYSKEPSNFHQTLANISCMATEDWIYNHCKHFY